MFVSRRLTTLNTSGRNTIFCLTYPRSGFWNMERKSSTYELRKKLSQELQGQMFVFPVMLVLILIITYPLLFGVYISLFNTNLVNRWRFRGLNYYWEIIREPEFYRSIWITFRFTFFVVSGHFILGGLLASIINKNFKGRLFFRAVLLLPWVIPDVSVALVFQWILNPVYGIFNHTLQRMHLIKEPIVWFGSTHLAFFSVVFVAIWKGYPLIMILVLAGLQSIPETLKEAAKIDGASNWQIQWNIIIPSLKPVLLSALILDTVWWFKHFTIIWLTTKGGPDSATGLLSINIYKEAFEYFRYGKSAAMAVLVFFICYAIGHVYRKVLKDES
jgi:multiple sugar transport system permease protein